MEKKNLTSLRCTLKAAEILLWSLRNLNAVCWYKTNGQGAGSFYTVGCLSFDTYSVASIFQL